jgi:cytochrome P450
VSAAFTRRRTDALEPRIQQITDELRDDLAAPEMAG